jgi:hypothetical protein
MKMYDLKLVMLYDFNISLWLKKSKCRHASYFSYNYG